MKLHLVIIIALLLVISGCVKTGPSCASPSIPFEEGCCLDLDSNNVCDRIENSPEAAEIKATAEETVEVPFNPVEETPIGAVEGEELAPTVTPNTGLKDKEIIYVSSWESIKLYYKDSIERCGKKIDFVSVDSSIDAGDSITLQIGIPRETIAKGDIGFVMESNGLDYVVQDFGILTGSNEGMSYVILKLYCK